MKFTYLFIFCFAYLLTSCNTEPKKITNANDYNTFLELEKNEMLQLAMEDYAFWEKKLEKEPNQFPYLAKAAASQSLFFKETGNIDALIKAEKMLVEANEKTTYKTSGYLRALARNYISQHKFKEALTLLKQAENIGENLIGTQKMLFDVHLELGNKQEAKVYLDKIENYKDFDFLIRLSKWSDNEGDLDKAILYLKKASEITEASNNKHLMQWSYTNLADYYGHAGEISKSYNHYLKALKLNPNDVYAKKGIAWIVYSYERNPEEALRILDSIMTKHKSPDYYLLKAEIAEYIGDTTSKNSYIEAYLEEVKNPHYGSMYNAYNVIIYAEELNAYYEAERIALTEVENRPTPQSYDLLAWTFYKYGDKEKALEILEQHVVNKTFEPEVLYHSAIIYKANNKINKAENLKNELLESTFELGPLMIENIKNI